MSGASRIVSLGIPADAPERRARIMRALRRVLQDDRVAATVAQVHVDPTVGVSLVFATDGEALRFGALARESWGVP